MIDIVVNAYLVPFVALIVLLFILKINHLFNQKQTKLFFYAVIVNLIMIAITGTDALFSQAEGKPFGQIRRITTFINFALSPLAPFFLFQIFNKVKGKYWLYIPFAGNVILCFVSLFNPIVFHVTTDNFYFRGTLFFIPFIISIFYTLLIVAYPSKGRKEGRRKERIFIVFMVIFLTLCLLLESLFYFRCLLYAASAIGIILYYVLQNILYFMTDPLTGVFNRQMYNHELEKTTIKQACFIVLADLNHLKQINDFGGHEAGDRALMQMAKSLYSCTYACARLYRIGGDEFVLISKKTTRENLCKCIELADYDAQKYGYAFAWGLAEYKLGDDLQEVLRLADKEMYDKKEKMSRE